MVAIYDVLKASKGIHVDDTFAELWGRKLSNTYTVVTYTGTLPATLQTVEGYLESYKIYGNLEQTGTPTPENPIVPSECGELETTGAHAGQYKLPLTSAGQSVDIYLGESQTTRRIRKLVLTGEEGINYDSAYTRFSLKLPDCLLINVRRTPAFCTHYEVIDDGRAISNVPDNSMYSHNAENRWYIKATDYSTVDDFKAYLAAKYTAGTPVTIWYILATEETGTLNEPLRKIGNYADTIDSTQTSAQIPTSAGSTTISWAGSGLAPSEVELTYRKPKGQ